MLLHFDRHSDNLDWFWATVVAGYLPALSTPLVNDLDQRRKHLAQLHSVLDDPTVLTTYALIAEFSECPRLRVRTVESLGQANGHVNGTSAVSSEGLTNEHVSRMSNGASHGTPNGSSEELTNGHVNGISNGVSEGYVNGDGSSEELTKGNINGISAVSSEGLANGHVSGMSNGASNENPNGSSEELTNGHVNGISNGVSEGYINGMDPKAACLFRALGRTLLS